jgi:hypothetical protein
VILIHLERAMNGRCCLFSTFEGGSIEAIRAPPVQLVKDASAVDLMSFGKGPLVFVTNYLMGTSEGKGIQKR